MLQTPSRTMSARACISVCDCRGAEVLTNVGGGGPCAFSTDAPASVGQLTAPSSTPQWQLCTLCRSSKCWCQLETGKRARAPRQLGSRRKVRRSRPAGMRRVGANGQARPQHFFAAAQPRSWTASRIGRRACSDARVDAGRARQLNGAGDARRTWRTAWTGRRARNEKKINASWCSCCRSYFPKGNP